MANKRVYYASQGVEVGLSATSGTTVTGAQSVTMNTNFNIEQVFQLGRLAVYDNVVGDPSVEVSITKALDGNPLIYNLAVGNGDLVTTSDKTTRVQFSVGKDTINSIGSTGTASVPQAYNSIVCDPIYLQSLSYNFAVDGDFTEEIGFIGLSKVANTSGLSSPSGGNADRQTVLRRQNIHIANTSQLPSGVGNGANISSISISADLGRESMYKLGQFAEFHRYVNFPLEITMDIEVIAQGLDTFEVNVPAEACSGLNLAKEDVSLHLCDSRGTGVYEFDLGNATLTSVAFGGGDTGGGNANLTFSYTIYNEFHPKSVGYGI